jgi:hypothetical protein
MFLPARGLCLGSSTYPLGSTRFGIGLRASRACDVDIGPLRNFIEQGLHIVRVNIGSPLIRAVLSVSSGLKLFISLLLQGIIVSRDTRFLPPWFGFFQSKRNVGQFKVAAAVWRCFVFFLWEFVRWPITAVAGLDVRLWSYPHGGASGQNRSQPE